MNTDLINEMRRIERRFYETKHLKGIGAELNRNLEVRLGDIYKIIMEAEKNGKFERLQDGTVKCTSNS